MSLNPISYVKESKAELDKVVWPTRMETIRLSIVVIIGSVIVGAYVAGLDAVFAKLAEIYFK